MHLMNDFIWKVDIKTANYAFKEMQKHFKKNITVKQSNLLEK